MRPGGVGRFGLGLVAGAVLAIATGLRVDGWMGSSATDDGCAGSGAAGGSDGGPDDRDGGDEEGGGSESAVVGSGAGLRDRRDLIAQPVRLPRRQGLHQLRARSGTDWQLMRRWPGFSQFRFLAEDFAL